MTAAPAGELLELSSRTIAGEVGISRLAYLFEAAR
jgi:hypothetical protein